MPESTAMEPDPHLQEEHYAPAITVPQGTQAVSVDYGYEERDINYRSMVRWFASLAAATGLILLTLFGAFRFLDEREERKDRLPSPLLGVKIPPPAPNLLSDPITYHEEQSRIEDEQLKAADLLNKDTGLPRLPADAARKVLSNQGAALSTGGARGAGSSPGGAAGPGSAGTRKNEILEPMPSESSGGMSMEDRLR
jgi:hypothetical protein